MNMQRPFRPSLSPADERRRVAKLQRQEIMLEEEVAGRPCPRRTLG